VVDQRAGALASALMARPALIDQPGGVRLATQALDPTPRPPPERGAGETGQGQGERGGRVLTAPPCFAASRSRTQPERLRALLLVMSGCWVVEAAWDSRLRHARTAPAATCPDHRGNRRPQPTARWVLQEVVGLHGRCPVGPWPRVRTRTADHQPWRRLLGQPSLALYAVHNSYTD
jgi:hypothetical protein